MLADSRSIGAGNGRQDRCIRAGVAVKEIADRPGSEIHTIEG
jgi:hypothetical protein